MTTRDHPVQIIDPPGVAPATSYSHVSRAGDFVHVAGQIAKDETGTWVGNEKVGAIGVRIARWVTSHGFAFNVANDLAPFGLIVPCGIRDAGVTSLTRLLGRTVTPDEVMDRLTHHFGAVFAAPAVAAAS